MNGIFYLVSGRIGPYHRVCPALGALIRGPWPAMAANEPMRPIDAWRDIAERLQPPPPEVFCHFHYIIGVALKPVKALERQAFSDQ
jgi:hypothetical protein